MHTFFVSELLPSNPHQTHPHGYSTSTRLGSKRSHRPRKCQISRVQCPPSKQQPSYRSAQPYCTSYQYIPYLITADSLFFLHFFIFLSIPLSFHPSSFFSSKRFNFSSISSFFHPSSFLFSTTLSPQGATDKPKTRLKPPDPSQATCLDPIPLLSSVHGDHLRLVFASSSPVVIAHSSRRGLSNVSLVSRKIHPLGEDELATEQKQDDWDLLGFASPNAMSTCALGKGVTARVSRKVTHQRWTPKSVAKGETNMAEEFISLRRSVDNVRR